MRYAGGRRTQRRRHNVLKNPQRAVESRRRYGSGPPLALADLLRLRETPPGDVAG
jgi:hypothetical protein